MNHIPAKYFRKGRTNRNEGTTDESCLGKHPELECCCSIPSIEISRLLSDPLPVRYAHFPLAIFSLSMFFLTQPEVKSLKTEKKMPVCHVHYLVIFPILSDLQPFPILNHSETFNGQ